MTQHKNNKTNGEIKTNAGYSLEQLMRAVCVLVTNSWTYAKLTACM